MAIRGVFHQVSVLQLLPAPQLLLAYTLSPGHPGAVGCRRGQVLQLLPPNSLGFQARRWVITLLLSGISYFRCLYLYRGSCSVMLPDANIGELCLPAGPTCCSALPRQGGSWWGPDLPSPRPPPPPKCPESWTETHGEAGLWASWRRLDRRLGGGGGGCWPRPLQKTPVTVVILWSLRV